MFAFPHPYPYPQGKVLLFQLNPPFVVHLCDKISSNIIVLLHERFLHCQVSSRVIMFLSSDVQQPTILFHQWPCDMHKVSLSRKVKHCWAGRVNISVYSNVLVGCWVFLQKNLSEAIDLKRGKLYPALLLLMLANSIAAKKKQTNNNISQCEQTKKQTTATLVKCYRTFVPLIHDRVVKKTARYKLRSAKQSHPKSVLTNRFSNFVTVQYHFFNLWCEML